ncbi:MAG: hypothetical protein HQL78_00875 [Magnetococcales bacterium]|nr:hypothetical protein [Magnetococcales bacterium]
MRMRWVCFGPGVAVVVGLSMGISSAWCGPPVAFSKGQPVVHEPPVIIKKSFKNSSGSGVQQPAPPAPQSPPMAPVMAGTQRFGLFEAMALAVKTGFKERTDRLVTVLQRPHEGEQSIKQLRALAKEAGLLAEGGTTRAGDVQSEYDPALVWSLVALGMEKGDAPVEPGGGEPSPSLLRISALSLVHDVRDAYWRAATADLLMRELESVLAEANGAAAGMKGGEKAQDKAKSAQSQKILLETVTRLGAWRDDLAQSRRHLAGLVSLPEESLKGRIGVAAAELHDPGIMALPMALLEDYALKQWAERMKLPRDQWLGAKQVEWALLSAFPGYAFSGLAHETGIMTVPGAPSWVEAGIALTGQLLNGKKNPAADLQTEGKVLRLAQGVGTLVRLHLALLECRLTEKRLQEVREHNKSRLSMAATAAAQYDTQDPVTSGIVKKAEGVMARLQQGLAFADNQAALARLLISLGRDPIPPMPELETLAPPALMANMAYRHESSTAALLSAWNVGGEPEVEDPLKKIAGTSGAADKGGMWQRLQDFSQKKGLPLPRPPRPLDAVDAESRGLSGAEPAVEGEVLPTSAD